MTQTRVRLAVRTATGLWAGPASPPATMPAARACTRVPRRAPAFNPPSLPPPPPAPGRADLAPAQRARHPAPAGPPAAGAHARLLPGRPVRVLRDGVRARWGGGGVGGGSQAAQRPRGSVVPCDSCPGVVGGMAGSRARTARQRMATLRHAASLPACPRGNAASGRHPLRLLRCRRRVLQPPQVARAAERG